MNIRKQTFLCDNVFCYWHLLLSFLFYDFLQTLYFIVTCLTICARNYWHLIQFHLYIINTGSLNWFPHDKLWHRVQCALLAKQCCVCMMECYSVLWLLASYLSLKKSFFSNKYCKRPWKIFTIGRNIIKQPNEKTF